MRKSVFISIALHLAILLWVLVVFPSGRALDAPMIEDVPIDIVTPSEFTRIKAGMVDEKDEAPLAPKPEEPKPKAVAEKEPPKPPKAEAVPPPPAPQEKAEEKPEPKPDKVEKPKEAEAKKEPLPKKAEAKPEKPKAKPKPAPQAEKKRDVNVDRMAALLNKLPDAAREARTEDAPQDTPRKKVKGQSSGTQVTMAVNEIDALRAKIAQCWNPPPGGLGADAIVVKLRLQLNEDGSLIGYPSVANSGGSPFFQAAADSAVRAVYQCQPYELPAEKYAVWRDMILNFDPRQMYGSG
ncbi:cell envelope integrity protein TolA [Methyloceanibacter sp.]|uniref:cell envelope integrity protein TolA n=1 Tax=Methyloceanibacter sp. TaxID=1965321 RepID=UPI003D6C8A1A